MSSYRIAKILNGSRLYGTHGHDSDWDYINIYLPTYKDVILGKANSLEISGESQDDDKHMSIYKFLRLLEQGQTVAVECLFAPIDNIEFTSEKDKRMWLSLRSHRKHLIGRSMKSMLGYCKAQAYKYCNKSKNLDTYLKVRNILKDFEKWVEACSKDCNIDKSKSYSIKSIFDSLAEVEQVTTYSEGRFKYLNLLGASFIETTDFYKFKDHVDTKIESCSKRTIATHQADGKDWKALSHALRVGFQLKELYQTNDLQFPLEQAEVLKAVKYGLIDYDEVVNSIESLTDEIEGLDFSKFSYDNNFVDYWLYQYIVNQNTHRV